MLNLDRLCANPPQSPLVVLVGTSTACSDATDRLVDAWVGRHLEAYDVVRRAPASGTWTVDEVSAAVESTHRVPVGDTGVVVLFAADAMPALAAQRLLIATESPAAAWRFVLCVADVSVLLATLRGRAGAVVSCPTDVDALGRLFAVAGVRDPQALARAVSADAVVVDALVDNPEAAAPLQDLLDADYSPQRPSTQAVETVAAATAVADLAVASEYRKGFVRRLAAVLLGVWDARLADLLPLPAAPLAEVVAARREIAASLRLVQLNGDPVAALAAALASAPAYASSPAGGT